MNFFQGIYGCREQALSEACISDFRVLYLHPKGSGHIPSHSAGPSVSLERFSFISAHR